MGHDEEVGAKEMQLKSLSFTYILEFLNSTQFTVCLGEQLIIMMNVAVSQIRILKVKLKPLSWCFYRFY